MLPVVRVEQGLDAGWPQANGTRGTVADRG